MKSILFEKPTTGFILLSVLVMLFIRANTGATLCEFFTTVFYSLQKAEITGH